RPPALSPFPAPEPSDLYCLSLHDALPISGGGRAVPPGIHPHRRGEAAARQLPGQDRRRPVSGDRPGEDDLVRLIRALVRRRAPGDRKSTRLNSSHEWISYAVFCLKKKTSR